MVGGGAVRGGLGRPELLPSPAAALLSAPLLRPPYLAPYSHLFSFSITSFISHLKKWNEAKKRGPVVELFSVGGAPTEDPLPFLEVSSPGLLCCPDACSRIKNCPPAPTCSGRVCTREPMADYTVSARVTKRLGAT